MKACEKHKAEPVRGYSECPGCEVESLRAEITKLKAENESLQEKAELYVQVQRAAGQLPAGWLIRVAVEHGGGGVEVIDDAGNDVEFVGAGGMSEDVSDALELAISLGNKTEDVPDALELAISSNKTKAGRPDYNELDDDRDEEVFEEQR
ncbi:hypothetical protein IYR97_23710 (plasmid) [Pseudomonas fulva]|uniref:Uncharacterized protein n=3 Tax=Pseudomonas TaxID=286 RepID=A0A1X0ZJC5_PSEPU|nr:MULTISPECIES: hypothetical protein [Pseudomonas]MCT8164050.1 hypothetical protein [Pseudomonas sp. HD6422]MCT8182962.1 hypothetical protein [Pseudomonas sp. HD6421]MDM1711769.1 hypothetical protein [Pseudomonas sp. 165]ORL53071.1 hypothetical protein B7H18_03550 [Pseudomonas putida]ORL58802.1 hypothetical protein B7H17_25065 [Pseudomonas putida]